MKLHAVLEVAGRLECVVEKSELSPLGSESLGVSLEIAPVYHVEYLHCGSSEAHEHR
jgi:hypothetical protein